MTWRRIPVDPGVEAEDVANSLARNCSGAMHKSPRA